MPLPSESRLFTQILDCTKHQKLFEGRALHGHVLTTGSFSCVYLANSLVHLYIRCSELAKAKVVFDNIDNKDTVSWNCLINGYSQQGSFSASLIAMELFRRMRAENASPNAHTFAGVFTAASSSMNVSVGQQAHSVAIKTASFTDVYVGSSLVNLYSKTGILDDARKVFDRMPERSSVSWATMISGYAKQKMEGKALEVFQLLRGRGEDESEYVYTSVLSALIDPQVLDVGKQAHSLAIKNGLTSIISVGNALVTMYVKCGSLDDAIRIFELSGDKNSITWSAMVTGFVQSGDSEQALKLFYTMHLGGNMPSEFTFVGVLDACSEDGAIVEGKQIHGYALKLGYESHKYVMTALVDMYAKCGSAGDAREIFDCIQEVDIVLWTSMIGGYVQNGENENALKLYCRMQMRGLIPNELTMSCVLKACSSLAALDQGKQIHTNIIKYGFNLEVPIGSALSTMYAKCGSLDDGNIVFWRMPSRDVVSWNAMISGLSQNGYGDEALQLFKDMSLEGTKPDHVTFVNVLSTCSHMGLVERGWAYFNMMLQEYNIVPTVDHYACMVDILSRAGKLNEAKEFIESAPIDHGMCLWRILLGACRNHRNYDLGAYAGEKLMELGSQESSAYVLLSSIYTALGQRDDVERVRSMMKLRGISKEPGCSWIELKNGVHVFVVGDQLHPLIGDIKSELQMLTKQMKDEGYQPTIASTSIIHGGNWEDEEIDEALEDNICEEQQACGG